MATKQISSAEERGLNLHEAERPFNLVKYILLVLIGSAIFLLPYARVVFYDELLGFLHITPIQLGTVLAIYGTSSTLGTFFSGILADRYSAKWLLIISLLATGAGGLILLSQPSYYGFMGLYILWGLSITFTYNSAHYKAIRYVGSSRQQGKLFGSVGGLRFLVSGSIAMIGAAIYAAAANTSTEQGFIGVITFYSAVYLAVAVAVFLFWKKDKVVDDTSERFNVKDALHVFKHPATWYIGFIIYGVYGMARCLDLIAPYMRDVMEIEPGMSAYINTFRAYLCNFIAGIGLGIILDRTRHKILACQISTSVAVLFFLLMALLPTQGAFWHGLFVVFLCIAVTGQFGAYITAFSLLEGANVPRKITGSIIGVSISIGFLPDIVINYLSNYLAETYGIADGCFYLIMVGVAHGCFAIIVYQLFAGYLQKLRASPQP